MKLRRVVHSHFIPRYVLRVQIIVSVSAVVFMTDSIRRYVRIYRFSYNAFSSLDHRDVDHCELGHIYHRNLNSFFFHHPVLTTS